MYIRALAMLIPAGILLLFANAGELEQEVSFFLHDLPADVFNGGTRIQGKSVVKFHDHQPTLDTGINATGKTRHLVNRVQVLGLRAKLKT